VRSTPASAARRSSAAILSPGILKETTHVIQICLQHWKIDVKTLTSKVRAFKAACAQYEGTFSERLHWFAGSAVQSCRSQLTAARATAALIRLHRATCAHETPAIHHWPRTSRSRWPGNERSWFA